MRSPAGLSERTSEIRYAAERRQGEALLAEGLESTWGWSGPAGSLRAARRAEFLAGAASLGPRTRCLEIGCGTGEFTLRLLESGCALTAMDVSEALADRCRKRVRARAEVVVANVESDGVLEGRQFDAVIGVSVLHHVNMEKSTSNIFDLLRPGGRFAFTEPNMANPQVWAERHIGLVRRMRHVTPHETAFHADELLERFELAGLTVHTCEPFEFLHPSTPRSFIPMVRRFEQAAERTPLRAIAASIRVAGCRRAG